MTIAGQVAGRSTCLRRHTGAVLVKDRRILATGLQRHADAGCGTARRSAACASSAASRPARTTSCAAASTPSRTPSSRRRCYGIAIDGAIIYTTHQPCVLCAKILINAGVREIVLPRPVSRPAVRGAARRGGHHAPCGCRPPTRTVATVSWKHYVFLIALAAAVTLAAHAAGPRVVAAARSRRHAAADARCTRARSRASAGSRCSRASPSRSSSSTSASATLGWGGMMLKAEAARPFLGVALGLRVIFVTGVLDDVLTLAPRMEVPRPARRGGRRDRGWGCASSSSATRSAAAWSRSGYLGYPGHAVVDRRVHERHQPHRRARRARRRRHGDRGHELPACSPHQQNQLVAAALAAALIGVLPRLPALQLQPGVHLHGRLGGDVPRLHARVASRCWAS